MFASQYDWGLQDDFMGSAQLDLTTLELSRLTELTLQLEDQSRSHGSTNLGEIKLNVTLWPRTQEDKEQVSVFERVSFTNSSENAKSQTNTNR